MLHIRAKLLLFASEFVRISEIALPVEDSLKSVVVSAFKWLNARKSEEWPLRYRKRHKCKKMNLLDPVRGSFLRKYYFKLHFWVRSPAWTGISELGTGTERGAYSRFFFFFFYSRLLEQSPATPKLQLNVKHMLQHI